MDLAVAVGGERVLAAESEVVVMRPDDDRLVAELWVAARHNADDVPRAASFLDEADVHAGLEARNRKRARRERCVDPFLQIDELFPAGREHFVGHTAEG